jgi:hypothetical protein
MEFRVKLASAIPDPARLDALLAREDPSAFAELDRSRRLWRVDTLLTSQHLVEVLALAGCPTSPWHVSLVSAGVRDHH